MIMNNSNPHARIEFHILQSFPVTCLNRDDVGAPKTAVVGGTVRQSTQVKDAGPDQQGLLVMNLCGLGLDCRGFDRPARWL